MIALVTDSTACLTKAQAHKLNVRIVPMTYTLDGKAYRESYADCNGDFEALLASSKSSATSQATVEDFRAVFEELTAQGFEIVCPVVSSRLSGAYSSACIAANAVDPQKILVLDSQTVAGGLSLLVKRAAGFARQGVPFAEMKERLKEIRSRAGIVFSVDNMDTLRKNGRLGVVRRSVNTILNFRPILICRGGSVVSGGMARGRNDRLQKLAEQVPNQAEEALVQSLNHTELVSPLLELLHRRLPDTAISCGALGPSLGINAGGGAVSVSWI